MIGKSGTGVVGSQEVKEFPPPVLRRAEGNSFLGGGRGQEGMVLTGGSLLGSPLAWLTV